MAADKIIFYSDRDFNRGIHNELYVIDIGGENLTKLTANYDAPYPDPDGITKILLRANDNTPRVVELPFRILGSVPTWSPNGAKIAFSSNRDGDRNIYTMEADWTHLTKLTHEPTRNWHPVWSSTGKHIAFLSVRNGDPHLYVMDADGQNIKKISTTPVRDDEPCWSPDGLKLCWVGIASEKSDLLIQELDSPTATKITTNSENYAHPTWSPNGNRIAFTSDRSGNQEIYTLQLSTMDVSQLTETPEGSSFYPLWSRDGDQILFRSDRLGNEEIFIMSDDGSNQRPVTNNRKVKYHAGGPHWIPSSSPSISLLQTSEVQRHQGILLSDDQVPEWPTKFAITFKNKSDQSVDVYWLPSQLSEVHQALLAPGASEAFWTFESHQFRFRNHESGFVIQEDMIAEPTKETITIGMPWEADTNQRPRGSSQLVSRVCPLPVSRKVSSSQRGFPP